MQNDSDIPPEVQAMLQPAMDAIREEVHQALAFSPRPGGGQRIDRVALVFARANDGGGGSTYQLGVNKIMDTVFGRKTLEEMRRARRRHLRDTGAPMVDNFPGDQPSVRDRDPDTIDNR